MKNQYVGDIGDYGKYSLLRAFSNAGVKIGINWYLTDRDKTNDGKFTRYLEKPEKYGMYDPFVFQKLKDVASEEDKSVQDIQATGILPGAVYYPNSLHPQGKPADRKDQRLSWFANSLPVLNDAELIFLDPDNGLLLCNDPAKRGAEKYALPDEIINYYETDHNVVYYCHKGRRRQEQWIAYKRRMFDLVPSARPIILTYHKGTQRSNVFLIHDKDYAHYQRIVSIVVNQWAPIFEPESLEK